MKIKTVAWIVCGILVGSLALVGLVKLTNNNAKVEDEPEYTEREDNDQNFGDSINDIYDRNYGNINVVPLTD